MEIAKIFSHLEMLQTEKMCILEHYAGDKENITFYFTLFSAIWT